MEERRGMEDPVVNPSPAAGGQADPQQLAEQLTSRLSPAAVIRCSEPLAGRTTLRVGGPADLYVEPGSEADLAEILGFSDLRNLPLFVLGRGSNLLVKDGGYRGIVVCLAHPSFARIEARGNDLACGAGARLKAVTMEAKRLGLAGLEFLEGIPGSVGGALRMNAGAMGSAMFEVVVAVRLMDRSGAISERAPGELRVSYRNCAALTGCIALAAVLRGQPGSRAEVERRMNEFSQRRWESQPAAPSAGCIFKNPASIPAGKLIDELGLKGTRVGGARVSLEHGNYLINDGTATAADVLALMELIRARAREQRGIELETEVHILGE